MKNSLEEKIKAAFENYEENYNPSDWAEIEMKLNAKEKIAKITKGVIYSAITIAASGLIFFFISRNNENTNLDLNSTKIIREKIETPGLKVNPVTSPSDNDLSTAENQIVEKEISPEKKICNGKTEVTIDKNPEVNRAPNNPEIKPAAKTESETVNRKPETASYPSPKADFRSDKNMICANSSVQFSVDNNDIPCEYRWDFGDGEFSGEAAPKHIYKNPGNFSVKLQVVSLIDKKTDIRIMKDMVIVNPLPVADFNWKIHPENTDINFESSQEDIVEWKWDFGDKQNSSEQKPAHLYNKKGNYQVSFSAKNNYGCTGTSQKNVSVINDFNLLAPNAFSPNGDGKNDTWLPIALISGEYVFSLTILDKNGSIAFKTTSANNSWDGRHTKTNDMVKTGDAFKWIALVKDKDGFESTYGGVISIAESSGF